MNFHLLAADAVNGPGPQSLQEILFCPTAWALVLAVSGLWLMLPQVIKQGAVIGGLLLLIAAGLAGLAYLWPKTELHYVYRSVFGILAALSAAGAAGAFLKNGPLENGKLIGGLLLVIALGLFGADLPWLANPAAQGLFWAMAAITLVAAIGCITAQSPVYSALWFAMSLLGTSGLFFLEGAQFLSVATIVVYAGAIVVTFLFVLMLAQPEGHAAYDRITWGWFPRTISVLVAGSIVAMLTLVLGGLKDQAQAEGRDLQARAALVASQNAAAKINDKSLALKTPAQGPQNDILTEHHMARLGGYLFTRHLISIEVAGTLLLAALVGAVAIAIQGKQRDRVDEALSSGTVRTGADA